jgi:uncharacterized membrane protein YqiK
VGFRDDGLASQERAEALEREVQRLRAENQALKERGEGPVEKPRRDTVARWAAPLGTLALLALVGAALVPAPPHFRLVLVVVAAGLLMLALQLKMVGSLLHVVEPGELLVLSGVEQTGPDGRRRGYRIVTGGRVLRKPLLETATWMALGPFPFTLDLRGVFVERERVDLRASAAIAVSTRPDLVDNAVERFLGRSSEEIVEVARQTVEGALRSVAAELTLDELQGDTMRLASHLGAELEEDLQRLGLSLDTLVIERVTPAAS